MSELPVIGSLSLCKGFWDRHGANIAARWKHCSLLKKMCGERLF